MLPLVGIEKTDPMLMCRTIQSLAAFLFRCFTLISTSTP